MLISLLVFLIVLGLVLFVVNQLPLNPPWIKTVVVCIIAIIAILWLLGGYAPWYRHEVWFR